ncbi:MAG: hypothetical protein ACE5OY_03230 [Candidatus Bathyarchaeia archaeon]
MEYPREHDVSGVLGEVGDRFPKWIRDRMPRIASSSTRLAHMRGPFVYGDEESPSPPQSSSQGRTLKGR